MKFLTLEQFTEMWKLQDQLNKVTSGPNWKELNQNWNLAIKSEVMEFFDYIGWKWWKEPSKTKKPSDMQARLELVDIWHFFLSGVIQGNYEYPIEEVYAVLADAELPEKGYVEVLQHLDQEDKSVEEALAQLHSVLLACEWSWDELYKAYIGKVALNNFRQANGYKEGTYQKIWSGEYWSNGVCYPAQEDNVFLEETLKVLEANNELTYVNIYKELHVIYGQLPDTY